MPESIPAIINLLTTLAPSVINLVMFFKDKTSGSLSAVVILDADDAKIKANQDQITAFITSKKQ